MDVRIGVLELVLSASVSTPEDHSEEHHRRLRYDLWTSFRRTAPEDHQSIHKALAKRVDMEGTAYTLLLRFQPAL